MPDRKCDVAVIGAGPAGSTTALTIAKQGFDVLLVEKDEYPGKANVCAGGTSQSIIKDLGLSPRLVEKEIQGGKHYFPWGLKSSNLRGITVYRNVFDRGLAEKAVEEGSTLLTRTMIKEVTRKSDRVQLQSKESSIDSKLVVFADGPHTLAHRRFGIGFEPRSDTTCISAVCEVKWEDNPLNQTEFYYGYEISPWGYGWLFPKRNTVNVGVGCLHSELNTNIIDSLNYLLRKHPLTHEQLKGKEIVWLRAALIPVAPAQKIFDERVLVVGDAAGMVDPVTGGGIMHAINGGLLAGRIACDALEKDDCSARFLARYQQLWQRTSDFSFIYSKYLLSNLFLYLFKFDKSAYPKLAALTLGGIKQVVSTLKFIYLNK